MKYEANEYNVFFANLLPMSTKEVVDLLNSIAAKDAETERLRGLFSKALVENNYQEDEINRLKCKLQDAIMDKQIEANEASQKLIKILEAQIAAKDAEISSNREWTRVEEQS